MKNTILKNEIIASVKGICSMVIIFFLGFFVMYSFWTNYDYPQDLPGLFYYRSATI